MILITFSLHSQISYPFLDGFDRERQKSKLQNYKIDHNRRPNRHHHHYHHDYYYHHFLSLSTFKSTKANDILLLPFFFVRLFAYFFFIKARGSEANPTCKMSTTCSGSVNNWSAMWQKSSSNTLSSWLDPSSLFFPWKKKKNKTNTYDNLAVHLFRHFRRKTFTFTQFVAEGKLWISNGLFIEINTFFCIFSITFTALLNAFSVCNVRTWEKRDNFYHAENQTLSTAGSTIYQREIGISFYVGIKRRLS